MRPPDHKSGLHLPVHLFQLLTDRLPSSHCLRALLHVRVGRVGHAPDLLQGALQIALVVVVLAQSEFALVLATGRGGCLRVQAVERSVTAVTLDLTVEWSFDLPSGVQPAETVVTVRAGKPDGELTELASETGTTLFREDSGSTDVSADLLAEGVVTASELAPGAGTRETDVVIEATFEVVNDEGTALASATASDTATLTVERTGYDASDYGSVSGSGSLTIETA